MFTDFLQSFANVYSELEKCKNSTEDNELIIMPAFPLWKAEYSYKRWKDILTCDTDDIFQLWKNIWVKKHVSLQTYLCQIGQLISIIWHKYVLIV